MRSMTGYGRAAGEIGGKSLSVQISSVNRRSLDLSISLPSGWDSLESEVSDRVRKSATRGKVHVDVELGREASGGGQDWDEAAIAATLDQLRALTTSRGIPFAPTADLVWQIAHSQRSGPDGPSAEAAREPVLAAVNDAVRSFSAMRAKEGEALLVDLLGRGEFLRRDVDTIAARAPQVAPAYRDQLMRRLREAGLELDLDDERVLREIALFADRCDISEEITRFRSHLEQLTALLRSEGEIGRKADFILQEMGREANTMGSKANDLAIARAVIELKNELERIREQLANVE